MTDLVGFNGTGVYNSSATPASLPWNTYNYCNAPHVTASHYEAPEGAELVYLNLMMRHHKCSHLVQRTPDNLYPDEGSFNPPSGWNCSDFQPFSYGGPGGTNIQHQVTNPADHPFATLMWAGTCDEGQLTRAGFEDARKHGESFWSVYHDKLHFLEEVSTKEFYVRTGPSDRTNQVASALLAGMDPSLIHKEFTVYTEPSTIDGLVPSYSCPTADDIRDAYQSVPAWTNHLEQYADLQSRLGAITGTEGLDAWESWYDHYFDTFTSRTCHGHPLPCNVTSGVCVSEEDATLVHALGDFEYNYIWNTAVNSTDYNELTFGVMYKELANNFQSFASGKETKKARLYVGHDGSMIRLAAGLGLGNVSALRWPALGSEIIMEVWKQHDGSFAVRVMHEGVPVAGMDHIPLADFIHNLEAHVPENLMESCLGTSPGV
ncbi:phosphoglycerate mutase-like protein [Peniophora sp. CONT]|nr:phosphoglycerate mutase-like protein [Peniophora sp. CONT]